VRSLTIETAEVFEPLLEPARDKGAWGGRGSGKSHFFGGLLVEDSLREPGESGEGLRSVCIREVQKDLAQSSKALIEAKLAQFRLGEADGFKVFKDCIATPKDGLIIFKGMQDYTADSIKSLENFKRAWWEEAQTASSNSVKLLRPTLRAPGAQLWWSWNPRRKIDPVDVMLRGAEKPSNAIVVKANWRDNPWLTSELHQERLDCMRMTPHDYSHVWEGDYVTVVEGAYYASSLLEARSEGRIGVVPRDKTLPVRAAWDIGVRDACAIWVYQHVGEEIRYLNYYEAVGQPLDAHLDWLRRNKYGNAICILPHDGAHRDNVTAVRFEDHIMEAGFDVEVVKNQGKGAAMRRVETARRLFPRMSFNAATTQGGLDALGWYHEKIDEKRNIGLGPEHDESSNGADAFGLSAVAYEKPSRRGLHEQRVRKGIV
jgi:phage terminase large subunit